LKLCSSVVCVFAETGTNSKRHFQRPKSNCGVAINSVCEEFMDVDQQTSQMLAPCSLAGTEQGPANHRGCGYDSNGRTDERTQCEKPEICLHGSYLKHSQIDVSENLRSLSQSPAPLLRSTKENRQGQEADQDTEQRTRDCESEGSVPAGVLGSSICLHPSQALRDRSLMLKGSVRLSSQESS